MEGQGELDVRGWKSNREADGRATRARLAQNGWRFGIRMRSNESKPGGPRRDGEA